MRKIQQIKILELLQTLKEATNELKKQSSTDILCGLLGEIQDFAFQIGEYIETVAGKGTNTVALLEEFCATIYEAYNDKSIANYNKRLRTQIISIENSVRDELRPNKIEIAFFPYKASMSDSLQTIWEAAMSDPDCDVVICPIPYFDRLPNGTLGEMHYEGGEYPKDLPIVNWQEYDVEARHPDVIFIHNPYDEGNYVTSIHPDFYSKRLREFTDMLVYIPYFVVADDVPEHFCATAGCVYAHKVIVQSEKVRDTYVRVFKETYGNHFGNPENKFIALGSPKFDRVLTTKREDCELPDEWAKIIDGKTVVLYNTTVGAILQDSEQYLKKLRSVLETFRKRDDVVLWWRPHPLSESTFESMRPSLAEEYREIVASVQNTDFLGEKEVSKNRVLLDQSPDLHRAIAWSDAYYGDGSSLVAMYRATGKPILLQDVNITERQAFNVYFEYIHEYDDYLWFTSMASNGFFRIDKKTLIPELVGLFNNEKAVQFHQYLHMASVESKLFFVPTSADFIAIYETKSNSFEYIDIPIPTRERKTKYNQSAKFVRVFRYEGYMFFIPSTYPGILQYNMQNGEIRILDGWIDDLEKHIGKTERDYFGRCEVVGDAIYITCNSFNAVLEFNMLTLSHKIFTFKNKNAGYCGVCYDGADLWLLPLNTADIIRFNPESGNTKEYTVIVNESAATDNYAFRNICFSGGYVWIFPARGDYAKVTKIDVSTGRTCVAELFQKCIDKQGDDSRHFKPHKFLMAESAGDRIYAFSAVTDSLLIYDCLNDEMSSVKINLSESDSDKIYSFIINEWLKSDGDNNRRRRLYESEAPLSNVLDHLTTYDDPSARISGQKEANSGEKIYDYVKKLVTS